MRLTDDDARMVAERLGLSADDADECRIALADIDADGLDAFLGQTLREAAAVEKAAHAGQATPATVNRTVVRRRVAEAFMEFMTLRTALLNFQGPMQ